VKQRFTTAYRSNHFTTQTYHMKEKDIMEEERRSGMDRRENPEDVDNDKRNGEERRAARRDSKYIIECMKKDTDFRRFHRGAVQESAQYLLEKNHTDRRFSCQGR